MIPLSQFKIGGYNWNDPTWYSNYKRGHLGVDLVAKYENLLAPFNAVVIQTSYNKSDVGNMIILRFVKDGVYCRLMHLSKINVKVGQIVTEGQIIGITGNTGMSQAPHLHLDLVKADRFIGSFWLDIGNFINPNEYSWVDSNIDQPIGNAVQGETTSATQSPTLSHFDVFNTDLSPSQNASTEVARMQHYLISKGFLEQLPDDNYGYYGNKTQVAVDKFQKAHGILNATKFGWWYGMTRAQANKDLTN